MAAWWALFMQNVLLLTFVLPFILSRGAKSEVLKLLAHLVGEMWASCGTQHLLKVFPLPVHRCESLGTVLLLSHADQWAENH